MWCFSTALIAAVAVRDGNVFFLLFFGKRGFGGRRQDSRLKKYSVSIVLHTEKRKKCRMYLIIWLSMQESFTILSPASKTCELCNSDDGSLTEGQQSKLVSSVSFKTNHKTILWSYTARRLLNEACQHDFSNYSPVHPKSGEIYLFKYPVFSSNRHEDWNSDGISWVNNGSTQMRFGNELVRRR